MSEKGPVPNLRACPIDRTTWDKMLAAYHDKPTISNVMQAGGVGKRVARRAILAGWPLNDLPSFIEIGSAAGTNVLREMAALRESWIEQAKTKGEAARMAAEQAMAARIVMDSALKASQLSAKAAAEALAKLSHGECIMPEELTPKVILDIIRAMQASADVVKRAMEIEHARAGEPEHGLGVELGIMSDQCTLAELEEIGRTGEFPARLLDQRGATVQNTDNKAEEEALKTVEQGKDNGAAADKAHAAANEDDDDIDDDDDDDMYNDEDIDPALLAAAEAEMQAERARAEPKLPPPVILPPAGPPPTHG